MGWPTSSSETCLRHSITLDYTRLHTIMMYTLWPVVKYVALQNPESFGEVLFNTCATAVYSVIAHMNG